MPPIILNKIAIKNVPLKKGYLAWQVLVTAVGVFFVINGFYGD